MWGLSTDHPPPDAAVEIDAPIDSAPCTLPTVMLPLVEEAVMIEGQPTQGHGLEAIMNVGLSEAILKFDTTNLPPDTQRFTLTLPLVQAANDCGPQCGLCVPIDKPGTIRVAYLRSDWAEATANYSVRSTGMAWQVVGANGASDRGPIQGKAMFAVATPLVNLFVRTGGLEPYQRKPRSSTISRSCSDHAGLRNRGFPVYPR